LPVVILGIVAVSVVIGIVPLRSVIGKGIGEAARVRHPCIGRVGETVLVHVATAEAIEPAYPA
tara:strand:- start:4 stop:192 length:189 start_codon:yes stop_codon:yes gene_type:complete